MLFNLALTGVFGVTIIFGFIPLALNLEEGGEMLQPMAAGAIGGLALGLFVALFLMPCFYVLTAYTRRPPGNVSSSSSS
ncbi:MAG: efflux RND transporter permease subunit [Desulfobaccales bacterium]